MLLCRFGPEGLLAAGESLSRQRVLFSDPFEIPVSQWQLGRAVDLERGEALRAPLVPGKIVCVGRNYRDHAAELGNPVPVEPLIFLKAPSSVIGPGTAIVLPPESARVDFEGEIALVVRHRLRRVSPDEALAGILGVTCACDVSARDLQKRDGSFSGAKSFDTFCPLGPAVLITADLENLEVRTRVNGADRQHGRVAEMVFGFAELLAYASRRMTLEPGDLFLTGTPAGVGPLADGDRIEVEIPGVGVLANPVEAWRQ
ncbi:MAG: fumarylacetoacetate hydrolase family protein [Thermoanaerobaculia bacterium]